MEKIKEFLQKIKSIKNFEIILCLIIIAVALLIYFSVSPKEKSNDEQEGDGHDRGVDILKLGGGRADRAKHEGIDQEAEDKEEDQIKEERDRNIKD